jgi:hypothetical protein
MMRILAFLILFLPLKAFGKAPECPAYSTKKECLNSVDYNYEMLLDFLKEDERLTDDLILAANDIKKYENLACLKTCIN